jgi:hypothetical protein
MILKLEHLQGSRRFPDMNLRRPTTTRLSKAHGHQEVTS